MDNHKELHLWANRGWSPNERTPPHLLSGSSHAAPTVFNLVSYLSECTLTFEKIRDQQQIGK